MGIYYIAACHSRREWLNPHRIKGQGVKQFDWMFGPIAPLVAALGITSWDQVDWISDGGDEYMAVKALYEDATAESVEWFNQCWPESKLEIQEWHDVPIPEDLKLVYEDELKAYLSKLGGGVRL